MNFYVLVLFLHIIGAAGLFLGLGIEGVTLKFLNRASSTEQVLSQQPSLKLMRITFGISTILLLLSGIYMVEIIWGWTGWVIIGLIILVVLSGQGSMTGKKIGDIMKSLSKSDGSISTEIKEKLSAPFLIKAFKIKILLVIGTIFIMTQKTDWAVSIISIVVAFLIGLLINMPLINKISKSIIEKISELSLSKILSLSFLGALLGIPLSYYFQPEIVKGIMVNPFKYIGHFDEILKSEGLFPNVIISVIIFAVVGGIIGYFVDKGGINKKISNN